MLGIFWGCVVSVGVVVWLVQVRGKNGGNDAETWAWIDVVSCPVYLALCGFVLPISNTRQIYALGYVKITTVVVKYIPQAWVNYKRKSTTGWSIYPIMMDFAGGWLSLAQLVIDSCLQNDWSGVTGNPVKFGLSNITIVFDIVFMLQHYVLYRHAGKHIEDGDDEEWDGEREHLVSGRVV